MTNQERELVRAFEDYFSENDVDAVMFRDLQHMGSDQKIDIFLDSAEHGFYGIEHKAKKIKSGKLYFSSHFSEKEIDGEGKVHQIETISRFLEKSGREGYLALQVRRGRGKSTDTYFIDWSFVVEKYNDSECSGIDMTLLDDMVDGSEPVFKVPRVKGEWVVSEEVIEKLVS